MSVNPGFGGQKFMPEVLDKIKELKKIREQKKLNFDIEIDGGINFDNCKSAIDAGANILVSGTTVFKSNDGCLLYTSPSPRDLSTSRMPSSA